MPSETAEAKQPSETIKIADLSPASKNGIARQKTSRQDSQAESAGAAKSGDVSDLNTGAGRGPIKAGNNRPANNVAEHQTAHQKQPAETSKGQLIEQLEAQALALPEAEAKIPEAVADPQNPGEVETAPLLKNIAKEPPEVAGGIEATNTDLQSADLSLIWQEGEVIEEIYEQKTAAAADYLIDYQTELFAEPALELNAQPAEISVPIEDIENSLRQIAERMLIVEPKDTGAAGEILDKIINLPAEQQAGREDIDDAELREELDELLIELFDTLQIEYAPELIESLVTLSLSRQLAEQIANIKPDKHAADHAAQAGGTHEAIKQLLAGLSNIKRGITNAYPIGRSALRLCACQYSPA